MSHPTEIKTRTHQISSSAHKIHYPLAKQPFYKNLMLESSAHLFTTKLYLTSQWYNYSKRASYDKNEDLACMHKSDTNCRHFLPIQRNRNVTAVH